MPFNPDARLLGIFKAMLFAICLLPLTRLLWAAWANDFGPEPEVFAQRWTGTWAFTLLLLTLSITPLRTMTGMHWLLRLRRMLGLFCFLYATVHFMAFIGFQHNFEIDEIARDIIKRPFTIVGLAAFVLLIPLAASSSHWAVRKMGGRKWQELHRSIYLIGILAAAHYFWLVKASDLLWPLAYSLMLAALLGWRALEWRRKAIPAPQRQKAKPLKFFKQKPE